MGPRLGARVVLLAFLPAAGAAQHPPVGAPAPAITAEAWLNWQGDPPTLESLAGRAVLLEFWGTWCAPCVRAMPGIQKLHDRYRERGLTVLAISYERTAEMQPFLTENGYTLPVGSDPEKTTIAAYGIRSWPTTILIDQQGKIAHVGSPYDAEAAVEKALGLEAGPSSLLALYFDSLGGARAEQRQALERLVEKAPRSFDLQAWALANGGAPEALADASAERPPPQAKAAGKPVGGADWLRRCAKAWGDAGQRAPVLRELAAAGPVAFDLAAFATEAFAKAFPLDAAELKTLLKAKQYGGVVEAIAQRAPATPVLAAAAKDRELAAFCKSKVGEAREMGKKGLMAKLWVFPGALPRDENVNREFFGELSVSGFATSQDKRSITGIMLGGEIVMSDGIDAFVESQLTQALVMDDLADGKPPRLRSLAKQRDQERAAIVRDLESRYGKPEPPPKK